MYENTSLSGLPSSLSMVFFTCSNGTAGTWSRHSLNSFTSSAGNKPSPLEMICPSLMYVEPRRSTALRMRNEMYARDSSGVANGRSFFLISHGNKALLSTHTTVMSRAAGGIRVGVVSTGTSRCADTRNSMAFFSHAMLFGSSTHGATLSNAPHAQSAGLELTGDVTHQVCPHEGHQ